MFKYIPVVAILFVTGCGGNTSPEALVYQAHLGYYTALEAVETYADLPKCSDIQAQPCRTQEASDAILSADAAAFSVLSTAQDVVRSESAADAVKDAAANNALSVIESFEQLLEQLGITE